MTSQENTDELKKWSSHLPHNPSDCLICAPRTFSTNWPSRNWVASYVAQLLTLQRSWVQIPMKTPENVSGAHIRQSLSLSSKCEDHFFMSSLNHTSKTFLSKMLVISIKNKEWRDWIRWKHWQKSVKSSHPENQTHYNTFPCLPFFILNV